MDVDVTNPADDDEWEYPYRMKDLVGKTVQHVYLDTDNENIVFDCGDVAVAYYAEGDCCSHSYFHDVDGVSRLIGARITATEAVDMPELPEPGEHEHNARCAPDCDSDWHSHEVTKVYGVKLTTTKGYVDIIFRNDSNGYYGGSLRRTYGKVDNLRELTGDWSA